MRRTYGRVAALALLTLVILFSLADAQKNAPPPKTGPDELTGWITDSVCGVKGMTHAHAAIMQQCIDKGANVVIVPDGSDALVQIENPADLKSHYGQRVVLDGYWRDGKFHIMSVRSI